MDLARKIMGRSRFQRQSSWAMLIVLCYLCLGCSQSDEPDINEPLQPQAVAGTISGIVSDNAGNVYSGVQITISGEGENSSQATNSEGRFQISTKSTGTYEVILGLPLATKAVSSAKVSTEVMKNQNSKVDFVIQPQPVKAHLNFGSVQLLEEIVDANGNTPVAGNEPLYAANIFDQPLGMLTAIKAPDGHHVTLSEFKMAKGNLNVHCDDGKAFVNVALEGMIPNGTYTFWLAYLNKTRKVSEPINFMSDFVYPTNPPIGASNGTENIAVADANGTINVTFEHASCVLTDEVALVIPILYHINGKTFGGGHVPDPEEMVHMLAYFQ